MQEGTVEQVSSGNNNHPESRSQLDEPVRLVPIKSPRTRSRVFSALSSWEARETLSVSERSRPTRANVGASPLQKFRKKWELRADHFRRIYCRLDVGLYIDDYIRRNLFISSRKKRFTRSLVEADTSAREKAKERGHFCE